MDKKEEKLCLSLKKLYGREKEAKLLRSVYDRLTRQHQQQENDPTEKKENDYSGNDSTTGNDADNNGDNDAGGSQVVLIGGQSGSGKSDLVWKTFANYKQTKNDNNKQKDCIFGYGKFQKRRDSTPFSVMSSVMSDIILSLQEMPNSKDYTSKLHAELGNDEILVIAKLVPMVAKCAEVDTRLDISLDTKEGLDRLKSAFRHFLRIISTVHPSRFPVVICFDDIQWACASTLDMITSILKDPVLRHVLVIGCYRDDELDTDFGGGEWIQTITESDQFINYQNRVTRIRLGNLTLLNVKELLSDVMKIDNDNEETNKLAGLIESRTCGNPFHVLQLIDYLQAEGLLKRSTLNYRWTWDYDKIQQQTMLSDNVVAIVTAKMKRFPTQVQDCLRLASCMGFRFCPQVLNLLVKHRVIECDNVDQSIQIAIDEGLVESSNDGRLKFVHDKVFETAYQMVSSQEAQAKIHNAIGVVLLNYHFNDPNNGNIDFESTREDGILKDDRTLFLCVDQLKLGREMMKEENNDPGGIKSDDFRLKAIKLHLQAAKISMAYSAFLPAINYLEESLFLLKSGGTATCRDDNDNDDTDSAEMKPTTTTTSEAKTGNDTNIARADEIKPKEFSSIETAEKFMDIVDVKDRKYRFQSYKNCFVGSEAVDAMISNSMAKTREEAVTLGRQLSEEFNLFAHVSGDHEFKDEHLFYEFNSIETTTHTNADGGDHHIYCDLYIEVNATLAEMYVTTGQPELAIKIVDKIMNLSGIPSEAKLPIYLIKCRILSNQSKHGEVLKKSLYILNYLEGKNYSYVEEPEKLRYIHEFQRIKWKLNKLSDEDILSLPLIQHDNKEFKRLMFIMQFIELSLYEAMQCHLHKLTTLLACRFVQLSLEHGIAPLSPMGFAILANNLVGTEDSTRHSSTSKFPKFPNLKVPTSTAVPRSRSFDASQNSVNDDERKSLDISYRLSNLAIALAKKQSEANIVARGMAGVYMYSSLINHLRKPIALVVDDLIKGYEFGMKIGDIPNSFRNVTAYFMFYFYSGLPLVPLLPDLKRFMQQMMDYSSYTTVRLNIPVYQCVLNLTEHENMLDPLEFRGETALDLRSKIRAAVGNSCEDHQDGNHDGEEAEWSYLMQIAFYCGEVEIAWKMYEKLQNVRHAPLLGVTPFNQARVFFYALIEMWYAKSTGKHKYNKDATKHVRVMRRWVNQQGMINCVHKLQILEAEVLSLDPHQNLDQLKKAYDTAIVSATRGGFLQDAAVANYLAGIHFGRVLLNDSSKRNDSNRDSTSSFCPVSATFSRLSDLSSFRSSTSSSKSTKTQSLPPTTSVNPDSYLLKAREMYETWGATAIIESLESNFPSTFRRVDSETASLSKRQTTGFRSRERFRESVRITHTKLPDHLRASVRSMATS